MALFNSNQIFIVTGASSGIGKATTLLLNKEGASVVAIARDRSRLSDVKKLCKYPDKVYIEVKDLTDNIQYLSDYVNTLRKSFGKFSGMAYCAGISCVKPARLIDYELMQSVFNINYFAPILMTKAILDRRNNLGKSSSLVYVSSLDAKKCTKGQCLYSGSKAALSASVKSLSKEASSIGVRMNCVLPSIIRTPMTASFSELFCKSETSQKDAYPWGWGSPIDVANLIVYLLSDKAKFISGQNYIVDSGGVL